MPRKEIDYSKTVIYKIVCNDLSITDIYVGSTTQFTKRKYNHKSLCANEKGKKYNYKLYKTIREHGGWENWSMIQIEEYPCGSANEARERERYLYEQLNASLNTLYPNRNSKEYYDENKEKIKERVRYYNDRNKEMIQTRGKSYYEANEDSIKEKMKDYYTANKDIVKERAKKYRESNKEKIKENAILYRAQNREKSNEYARQYRSTKKSMQA
jgi:hypothetical protein